MQNNNKSSVTVLKLCTAPNTRTVYADYKHQIPNTKPTTTKYQVTTKYQIIPLQQLLVLLAAGSSLQFSNAINFLTAKVKTPDEFCKFQLLSEGLTVWKLTAISNTNSRRMNNRKRKRYLISNYTIDTQDSTCRGSLTLNFVKQWGLQIQTGAHHPHNFCSFLQ